MLHMFFIVFVLERIEISVNAIPNWIAALMAISFLVNQQMCFVHITDDVNDVWD